MNGNTIEGVREQIEEVSALASLEGRKIKFGLNSFIIVRDTEAEAHEVLRDIITQADVEAVKGFGEAVKQAGLLLVNVRECGRIPILKTWCNITMASVQA